MKLKEFLDKYGTNTTSNFQLLHWGKQLKLKNFRVVMKDEIKDIDSSKPVLNLITNSRCKMGILGQVALNDPAQNPHLGKCTQ